MQFHQRLSHVHGLPLPFVQQFKARSVWVQRGNARQFILTCDAERMVYLDLLRQAVRLHPLSLIGYCLMSNHVHLVVIPSKPDALAKALKQAHGRYAGYWNAPHASSDFPRKQKKSAGEQVFLFAAPFLWSVHDMTINL